LDLEPLPPNDCQRGFNGFDPAAYDGFVGLCQVEIAAKIAC